MITQSNIQRPAWADQAEIIALLVGGLLVLFLSRWTYAFIPVIAVLGSSHFVVSYLYSEYRYLVDITAFVGFTALVYIHAYSVKFLSEYLQKSAIKKQFGSYVNPIIVERLQKDPSFIKLGGEKKDLSIIMSDMRNFTGLGETYGDDVVAFTQTMNRYMTAMTAKIIENEGTLDKYIGDAQMAFWNAPLDDANHAKNAVRTALEMMESLNAFNREVMAEGVPPFGMGLGINTATVVVGNMGSDQRFDYTCLGDGVNLASRLEGQSKPYHVKIVLGPLTARQVIDEYFTLELDCLAVKGKKEGVNIFTVLGTNKEAGRDFHDDREVHDLMLHCYRTQAWASAAKLIGDLKGSFASLMDNYYDMMLERIAEYRENPPDSDWDGVFRTTTK
jgi:adenylate cyclase